MSKSPNLTSQRCLVMSQSLILSTQSTNFGICVPNSEAIEPHCDITEPYFGITAPHSDITDPTVMSQISIVTPNTFYHVMTKILKQPSQAPIQAPQRVPLQHQRPSLMSKSPTFTPQSHLVISPSPTVTSQSSVFAIDVPHWEAT